MTIFESIKCGSFWGVSSLVWTLHLWSPFGRVQSKVGSVEVTVQAKLSAEWTKDRARKIKGSYRIQEGGETEERGGACRRGERGGPGVVGTSKGQLEGGDCSEGLTIVLQGRVG